MRIYRCNICGEPILQLDKPSCCPFCGAHRDHIVLATEFRPVQMLELSELSKANLEYALEVEISNAHFYKCASDVTQIENAKQLFKALSKIESEHASTISKALAVAKPGIEPKSDDCHAGLEENYDDAKRRETSARTFYQKAAAEAIEPRVSEIFSALSEVENDHIEILTVLSEGSPGEQAAMYS